MLRPKHGMPPPMTRREYEHNLGMVMEDFLRAVDSGDEALIQNKMYTVGRHLSKVGLLPNGRIDLATINEMVRLHANTLNWMSMFPSPRQINSANNDEEE